MKNKKWFITFAVTIIGSLFLFTACKQHPSKGAFMIDYISEAIDLTQEQQENLNSIRTEIMDQVEQTHEDKSAMHDSIKAQLGSDSIDKEAIRQLIATHRAKMDNIIDLAVDRLAEFHSELSFDQKEKLIAKLEKFEKYHSKRFHH